MEKDLLIQFELAEELSGDFTKLFKFDPEVRNHAKISIKGALV